MFWFVIVLHVWVRKKIRRTIYKKKGWHSAFLKAFFTNRWSAPVPSITRLLRAKMPAATFKQSTTGRCEFVKNAFKKCSCCHPFFLINSSSYLLSDSYNGTLFKSLHIVYVKWYWLISFGFVDRRSMKFINTNLLKCFGI